MTFSHFNRRLHLYLGLALLPWFLMYGVSSIPFAHNRYFEDRDKAKGLPQWTLRMERTVDVPVPHDEQEFRTLGAALLKEAGIEGTAYGVYRQSPTQLNVYSYSFWKSTQLRYLTDEKKLIVQDHRFRWDHFLTGMHGRGGFEQDGLLQNSWSIVVDVVCIGLILWIASGIYMWWGIRGHRGWGWLAISSGTASFLWFMFNL